MEVVLMSVNLYVSEVIPADEKYNKMLSILNACKELNISPPDEVAEFFDHNGSPNIDGYETSYSSYGKLPNYIKNWEDNYRSGFEIEVDKIPKKVKIIRCYNA